MSKYILYISININFINLIELKNLNNYQIE